MKAAYIPRQCPVCRNTAPDTIVYVERVQDVYRIECMGCDTVYFDREPPYEPRYDLKYNMHFFRPGDIRKAGVMAARLAELIQGKWKRPNILEAGTGNGLTVFLLRAMGYNAFGIDLDEKLSVYLMEKLHIPVITGRFEEFRSPTQFHLIYSSHVIEHQKNPWAFFQNAYDLLFPGGIFYVDTPDVFFWRKAQGRWHHFETRDPYEHCCLLGDRGIICLGRGTGFEIQAIERYSLYDTLHAVLVKPGIPFEKDR